MPEQADLRQPPANGRDRRQHKALTGGVRLKTIGGRTHGITQAPLPSLGRGGSGRAAGVVRPAKGRNSSGSTRGPGKK